jgi:hypothetical protein
MRLCLPVAGRDLDVSPLPAYDWSRVTAANNDSQRRNVFRPEPCTVAATDVVVRVEGAWNAGESLMVKKFPAF